MIRKAVYKPEDILKLVDKYDEYNFDGIVVSLKSIRYFNFKEHGVKCVSCGRVGTIMALEKHRNVKTNKYHFNLYAQEDGREILMTVDHIIPKSKGGYTRLDNLQTMCFHCNHMKDDMLPSDIELNSDFKQKKKRKYIGSGQKVRIGSKVVKRSGKKFKNGEYEATVIGSCKKEVPAFNGGPNKGKLVMRKFFILKGIDNPVPEKAIKAI